MMNKKSFKWMLMAALVVGFSLSFTACSDDDDDNKSGTEQSDVDPLDNDEARTAFRWLCVLSNVQTLDEGWQSKTYEPTVGEASDNNEYTRLVVVNSLDEAKQDFASFADKEPSELASKVTINGGAAGTMVWEPSAAGAQNLAVVTVTSRIMPHLQKLVYCTEDQKGQNGSLFGNNMKGTPYYRFGDVIQDPDGYYWVCVRPCFAANPADKTGYTDTKGDSHWINIFNASQSGKLKGIPKTNVKDTWNDLAKYNHQTIKLPTGLAYNRQHIYNLSQLLWALLAPEAYAQANTGVSDRALGGFPYRYNGKKFVQAVSSYWDEKVEGYTIWEKLFNCTREQLSTMKEINFIYQGYSWKIGNSGYIWNYTSTRYQDGYTGKDSNDKTEINFVEDGFDIYNFASTPGAKSLPYAQFSQEDENHYTCGTWVVRYKKGEDLMTAGKFSYYAQIASRDGNQKDVYRYNAKKNIVAGENVNPETEDDFGNKEAIAQAQVKVGDVLCTNGKFYETCAAAKAAGATPAAMVCFIGDGNTPVEANRTYNALAIAPYKELKLWNDMVDKSICTVPGEDDEYSYEYDDVLANNINLVNGLEVTQHLAQHKCKATHVHPAAEAAYNKEPITAADLACSRWFLPSAAQWKLAYRGMGYQYDADTKMFTGGQWKWTDAGFDADKMTNGWSCTEMVTNKESMYAYIIATTQLTVFEKNTPQRLYTMVAMKLNR